MVPIARARVQAGSKRYNLYVLGEFRLEANSSPHSSSLSVTIPTRKLESLLSYLALYPGPQPREKLAALFWGDAPELQARNSLRNALSVLRRNLGSALLCVDRECAGINPEFPLWVDAHEFKTGSAAFLAAPDPDLDCVDLSLYRGDLLTGMEDEWIAPVRVEWRALYVTTLLGLVQAARAHGEYERAIEWAQKVLALDPINERAHQHLMFAYLVSGNRRAALEQYETCRRTLQEKMDLEPMSETTKLYDWIRQAPPSPRSRARLTNLPIPLSNFIGRKQEVSQVKRLLASACLVTLTGAGGSGKTRLAIQTATDLLDQFHDGVWWIELSSLSDPTLVSQLMIKTLDIHEHGDRAITETLADAIGTREMLLVLDNCEHLVQTCAEIAGALVEACPNLKILATSREELGLACETTWLIPLLTVPDLQAGLSVLGENDAVRLFLDRARATLPNLQITAQNCSALAQICHRLDGIPLAIELAAARVSTLALDDIAARLDNRFNLLTFGKRTALPRQQTLRSLIDWSYDLLSTEERILFRRLAALTGGRTIETAEAICCGDGIAPGSTGELIAHLVSKSLLYVEDKNGETRYRFLETIRQYAREKLVQSTEIESLRRRHSEYFLQWAEQAAPEFKRPAQSAWLNRAEAEHENLRAALQYLFDLNEVEKGLRLATSLARFWEVRGYSGEGLHWLAQFLAARMPVPALLRGKALQRLGYLQFHNSDYANARNAFQASLALQTEVGDTAGLAQTLSNLAGLSWTEQNYAEARRLLEKSLSLYRELGSQRGISSVLNNLGIVTAFEKDYVAARRYLTESCAIAEQLGETAGQADALENLTELAILQEDLEYAQQSIHKALEIYRSLQLKPGIVRSVQAVAALATLQGRAQCAGQLFGAVDAMRQAIQLPLMPNARADYDRYLGTVRQMLGEPAFVQAWELGRILSMDQAIDLALRE